MSLIPEENLANLSDAERAAVRAVEAMIASQNSKRPLLDPEDDEGSDGVEFTKTGWVRFYIGDERWRLRPPFFADLRSLSTLLEEHQDGMTGLRAEVRAKAASIQKRLTEEVETMDDGEEKGRLEVELTTEMNETRRKVQQAADDARIAWYTKAFELLNVDRTEVQRNPKGKVPRQWPAWVADVNLPAQLLEHWRSVPLGRGSGRMS